GDGGGEVGGDVAGDHVAGDADRVHHGGGPGGAVADDAHAVDAEEPRPAGVLRVEGGVQRQQLGQQHLGRDAGVVVGVEGLEQAVDQPLHPALERLERHVAGEAVGDHDVDGVGEDVATLDVADEGPPRRVEDAVDGEQLVG